MLHEIIDATIHTTSILTASNDMPIMQNLQNFSVIKTSPTKAKQNKRHSEQTKNNHLNHKSNLARYQSINGQHGKKNG